MENRISLLRFGFFNLISNTTPLKCCAVICHSERSDESLLFINTL